jgi:hypothetical protein
MSQSPVSRQSNVDDATSYGGGVSLESILCTELLYQRPFRPPDHRAENQALAALAQALCDSPLTILQTHWPTRFCRSAIRAQLGLAC